MSVIKDFQPNRGDTLSVHFSFRPQSFYTAADISLRWLGRDGYGEHTLWSDNLLVGAVALHGLDPAECALVLGDELTARLAGHHGVYHNWPGPRGSGVGAAVGAPGGATGSAVDVPLPGLEGPL